MCVHVDVVCLFHVCILYVKPLMSRDNAGEGKAESVQCTISPAEGNNDCKVLSTRVLCLYCLLNMEESLFMVILCVFACVVYPRTIIM